MKTIIVTARKTDWEKAQATGQYTQSTIDSSLAEVGFIHCSFPDQVLNMVNRKYADQGDLLLLFIDAAKVRSEVKYEVALSGRAGTFPHIYGSLNVDAVYEAAELTKGQTGKFIAPDKLQRLP